MYTIFHFAQVLPYCIANVIFMIFLTLMNEAGDQDWGITSQGHTFASMIVSFLVVSRVNMALARYTECRNFIGIMYRETSECNAEKISLIGVSFWVPHFYFHTTTGKTHIKQENLFRMHWCFREK